MDRLPISVPVASAFGSMTLVGRASCRVASAARTVEDCPVFPAALIHSSRRLPRSERSIPEDELDQRRRGYVAARSIIVEIGVAEAVFPHIGLGIERSLFDRLAVFFEEIGLVDAPDKGIEFSCELPARASCAARKTTGRQGGAYAKEASATIRHGTVEKGRSPQCRAGRHLEPGFKRAALSGPSGASAWGRTPARGTRQPR